MTDARVIRLVVNGQTVERTVEARMHLGDFLRKELKLTGTHLGCEHGVCGACTILVDGMSARSCLMLAVQADGREIQTIEGVAPNKDELHPIQAALSRHHGLQCGFCTPGVVMTMLEIERESAKHQLSEAEIRHLLSGNLCRCTGYQGIVDAALELFGPDASPKATSARDSANRSIP